MDAAYAAGMELGAPVISPGAGALLRTVVAASQARSVLEIGTGTGVSGLWILSGLQESGVLTTLDTEAEFHQVARQMYDAGYPVATPRMILGQPTSILPRMADGAYDIFVLNVVPSVGKGLLEHAKRLLRPGGSLVVLHALWHGNVADPTKRDEKTVSAREILHAVKDDDTWMPCLSPAGDGVLIAIKS